MQVTDILVDETKRELTVQSQSDFPLAVYYSVMSRNILGYTRLHWHPEFQLCLVRKGRICFYVNDTRFVLAPGEGIFINSGLLHLARPIEDPDSSYICLNVAPKLLSGFSGSLMEQRYILPLRSDTSFEALRLCPDDSWQSQILDQIEQIYLLREDIAASAAPRPDRFGEEDNAEKKAHVPESRAQNPDTSDTPTSYSAQAHGQTSCSELRILAIFYDMFHIIIGHRPKPQAAGGRRRARADSCVQKIITHIGEHYTEHLTLQDIADVTSYTESECCRIFKRFTGESIFSYLRAYRLEKSVSLLQDTRQSISEIAYGCGFSSTSYYIEEFKKQFKITPLQFRNSKAIISNAGCT